VEVEVPGREERRHVSADGEESGVASEICPAYPMSMQRPTVTSE